MAFHLFRLSIGHHFAIRYITCTHAQHIMAEAKCKKNTHYCSGARQICLVLKNENKMKCLNTEKSCAHASWHLEPHNIWSAMLQTLHCIIYIIGINGYCFDLVFTIVI